MNKEYERYKFRQAKQETGETFEQFYTRLRQLSRNCEFIEVDDEIKSQLIMGCVSTKLRRKALSETMTLTKLLQCGRSQETAEDQATQMEGKELTATVNKLVTKPKFSSYRRESKDISQHKASQQNKKCYFCGGPYPHVKECPAKGKVCQQCKKIGHFAKVCRSRSHSHATKTAMGKGRLHNLQEKNPAEESADYVFNLGDKSLPQVDIIIGGHLERVLVDTGSTVNVLNQAAYQRCSSKALQPSEERIFPYGCKNPIEILGQVDIPVESCSFKTVANFQIVKEGESLINSQTALRLHLISFVNTIHVPNQPDWKAEFPSVFQGIGKLKDYEVKLHIDLVVF